MPKRSTAAAIGLTFLAACGGRPGTPASPTAPMPPAPSSSLVSGIRIEGPSSIAPGASAQYRAIASFADGRTADVTGSSSWRSEAPTNFNPPVLVVTGRGAATGSFPGEADVVVSHPDSGVPDVQAPGSVTAKLRVLVLEPGTFRVSGRVTDSRGPLPTARVAVVAGTGAGQVTGLRGDGTYALYGLTGPVTLEVSEESFQTQTRTIAVNDHQSVDFSLELLAGYIGVNGEWRLTLRAALSCGSDFPAEAATRTFEASMSQRGSAFTFSLGSPTVVRDTPELPFGGVGPDRLDFYLAIDAGQTPPVWVVLDRLNSNRFVGIGGNARGLRSGNDVVVGTLSGEFSIYRATGTTYRAAGTTLERSCRRLTDSPFATNDTHTFHLDRMSSR